MDVKSRWTTIDPVGEEDVCRARSGVWTQSSRLSRFKNNVTDGVVTADTVTVASTSHLGSTMTLRVGELVIVQRDP